MGLRVEEGLCVEEEGVMSIDEKEANEGGESDVGKSMT